MTEAKKAAAVNYTAEMTQALIAAYKAGETVEALAERFARSKRSIVAKLSREGCYIKNTRVRKDGTPVQKKVSLADTIGNILGLSEPDVTSLEKANRSALMAIFKALANSKPV